MSFVPKEPVVVLTASDVEMLWRSADLDALRRRHRQGDTRLYALLVQMHTVRLQRLDAGNGTQPRQETASEEREYWTVRDISRTSRRAERTVRKDIELGELAATKRGRVWIISRTDAETYINNRRRTR